MGPRRDVALYNTLHSRAMGRMAWTSGYASTQKDSSTPSGTASGPFFYPAHIPPPIYEDGDGSIFNTGEVPEDFEFSISVNPYQIPMVASDGHTYEYSYIIAIWEKNKAFKSAFGGGACLPYFYYNYQLAMAMDTWAKRVGPSSSFGPQEDSAPSLHQRDARPPTHSPEASAHRTNTKGTEAADRLLGYVDMIYGWMTGSDTSRRNYNNVRLDWTTHIHVEPQSDLSLVLDPLKSRVGTLESDFVQTNGAQGHVQYIAFNRLIGQHRVRAEIRALPDGQHVTVHVVVTPNETTGWV